MADSDDEHERGRRGSRDKFRRERSDYSSRSRSGRDDWDRRRDSGSWNDRDRDRGRRRDHREYDSGQRRGRRDGSPPYKRAKRDWDDGFYREYGMQFSQHMPHPMSWSHPMMDGGRGSDHSDYPTQPPMMSFRQYLNSQTAEIEETEAVQKYAEYKKDFRRKVITDFFDAHKEEEWLRVKYHPVESVKHEEEQKVFIQQRKKVFFQLLELGQMEGVPLDIENQRGIVKMLDAAVILLEGGTAFDLQSLDDHHPIPADHDQRIAESDKTTSPRQTTGEEEKKDTEKIEEQKKEEEKVEEEKEEQDEVEEDKKDEVNEEEKDEVEEEEEKKEQEMETEEGKPEEEPIVTDNKQEEPLESTETVEEPKEELPSGEEEPTQMETETTETTETVEEKERTAVEGKEVEGVKETGGVKPRPLHTAKSIYIRTLAPNIKKSDVVEFAHKIPGYLRVAFAEPQAERRYHRRGWITFQYDVDIKKICSQLNNTRVGDFELNMMVNRDFTNRVRHVSGFSATRQLAARDLKSAIKLIRYLDERANLWKGEAEGEQSNPLVLKVEEVLESEATSEEWMSKESVAENGNQKEEGEAEEGEDRRDVVPLERNAKLLQALDKALMYLRVVHSLDYYDAKEYPNEDHVPNRCCILHVRGILPSKATQSEVLEYWNACQQKLNPFFKKHETVPDDEARELGLKDPEAEVQAFIQSNTQELGKDKWLCPLSGKKFRGPVFVVKHIQNKHADKLDNVRYEAQFLNAYIRDPNRPNLPPAPQASGRSGGESVSRGDMVVGGPPGPMAWGRRPMMYGAPFGRFGFGPEMFPSPGFMMPRRGRQDPRGIRDYRDLDAPEEIDV